MREAIKNPILIEYGILFMLQKFAALTRVNIIILELLDNLFIVNLKKKSSIGSKWCLPVQVPIAHGDLRNGI